MAGAADGAFKDSKAPSVARALMILRLLSGSRPSLSMSEIARELGLVPSTCLHIVRVLEQSGILYQDKTSRLYRLGTALVSLGAAALKSNPFARIVGDELQAISERFGVTTSALQLEVSSGDFIVIATRSVRDRFCVQIEIGRRVPAFMSAMGRCYAAHNDLPEKKLRTVYARLEWDEPPGVDAWLEQIDDARAAGVGYDRGEYMRGFQVRTAPIFQMGEIVRGISAVYATDQLGQSDEQALCVALRTAAHRLEQSFVSYLSSDQDYPALPR